MKIYEDKVLSYEYDEDELPQMTIINEHSRGLDSNKQTNLISDFIYAISINPDSYKLSRSDIQNITVIGPYEVYRAVDEKTMEVTYVNYHVVCGGVVKGIISTYYINGSLNGEYSIGYANEINLLPEDFVLIQTTDGIYALLEDNTSPCISEYRNFQSIDYVENIESTDIIESLSYDDFIQYKTNLIYEVSINAGNTLTQRGSSQSVSVPLVTQWYNNGIYPCHEVCMASIVAAREPNLYSGLGVYDVYRDFTSYDPFHDLNTNRASEIKAKMRDKYLDKGQKSHYTIAYIVSLSMSSYISMIDNDCALIAIATNENSYHATVMCGYTYRSGGGVLVNMMDPFTETFRLITWTSGTFAYLMNSQTMTLSEFVISYY